MLKAYKLDATHTSPQPMFGSYDDTGLDSTFCFDRFARFDSYGYDEDVSDAASEIKREEKIDWEKVDWAKLQEDCLVKNQNRYESIERANHTGFWMPTKEDFIDADSVLYFPEETRGSGWWSSGASFKKRSAVVFHVEAGKEWTVDTLQYIRSVIQELSLHSGAEYEVIILVEIETAEQPNLDDPSVYRSLLRKSVPLEFIGNTLLFSRDLFEAWYPKVIKQRYASPIDFRTETDYCSESNAEEMDITQALQLLSILRPDIEHFWQFEVDARYSGHHYQHLETISAWSKAQPRRLLWERSSRYFVPAVHGNWTAFSNMIQNRTADGGIWGPVPPKGIEPIGPDPPVSSPQLDDYHWGVGEDADFIAAAPIVDATGSGASEATSTNLAGTGQAPSRMTSLSIMTRFSKRLLRAMHHGQITSGSYMNPNKFPASIALHHGLKAVAFPLPIYLDYAKAPSDVEKEFNFNGGRDVYDAAQNFEEIGHRMTYFSSKDKQPSFADDLYKRWLGYVSLKPWTRNSVSGGFQSG